MIVSDRY